jgi:hypothetical protein
LRISPYQLSASIDNKTEYTFVKALPASEESKSLTSLESSCSIAKKDTCLLEIHRPNGSIIKISDFPVMSLANIILQFVE